ncbi:MAG: hypothetical protein ACM3RX_02895 [Methanococcaceae archaeon]
MIVKTDGSVINAGADPNIPNYQVCMFKYDSTGGLTWEKNVIIGTNETVRSMCSTTDGSIFITGVISAETQEQFPYVAKILSNGSLQSKIDFTVMKGTDFKPIVIFEEGGKFLYFGYCKNYSGKSGIVIKKGNL